MPQALEGERYRLFQARWALGGYRLGGAHATFHLFDIAANPLYKAGGKLWESICKKGLLYDFQLAPPRDTLPPNMCGNCARMVGLP